MRESLLYIENIEIDNDVVEKDYKIMLHKMSEEIVTEITWNNVSSFEIDKNLANISELRFTVPSVIMGQNGQEIDNPLYPLIDGMMLISIDDMEMYTLRNPTETMNKDNYPEKQFIAYSREYELRGRIIDKYGGFGGEGRMLYDPNNTIDDTGEHVGFFNYVEDVTSWRIDYVNPTAAKKRRGLNISNTNLISAIREVEEAFDVVCLFDTMDKAINIYDVEQLGMYTGLDLSSKSLVKDIRSNIDYDSIVTRLYGYGYEDVTIASVNLTGLPFVEDISFFVNEDYMTRELIEAIGAYNDFVETTYPTWEVGLNKTINAQKAMSDKQKEIEDYQLELNKLQHVIDGKIYEITSSGATATVDPDAGRGSDSTPYAQLTYSQAVNRERWMQTQLTTKKNELQTLRDNYIAARQENATLQTSLQFEEFLETTGKSETEIKQLMRELDPFIIEESFVDDSYTVDFLPEFKEEMEKKLAMAATPSITIDMDVFDFISDFKTSHMRGRMKLGDIMRIDMTEYDKYSTLIDTYLLEMRLTGYRHDPIKETLELKFMDKNNIRSNEIFLSDILAQSRQTSNKVNFNEMRWGKGEQLETEFTNWLNSELDLSKQKIITADGQKPILDDRGLWLYKENPDGTISNEQIRAINNVIAITKDNWNTIEVAMTPKGVMAKQLIGDIILGNDLKILSDSGIVQITQNLLTIKDNLGRVRVSLGEYKPGIFGLELKNKSGTKVVLDENGMLQSWQESTVDNCSSARPLRMNLYLPEETMSVYKSVLRFQKDSFRSYSSGTTASSSVETTSNPAYSNSTINSTNEGDVNILSSFVDRWYRDDDGYWDGAVWVSVPPGGGHNHGIENGTNLASSGGGYAGTFEQSGNHQHTIKTKAHKHSISSSDLGHAHKVQIPSHSHDTVNDIFEYHVSSNPMTIRISNATYSNQQMYYGSVTSRDDINIGVYLKPGWNEITFTPNARTESVFSHIDNYGYTVYRTIDTSICRIDATVFLQVKLSTE